MLQDASEDGRSVAGAEPTWSLCLGPRCLFTLITTGVRERRKRRRDEERGREMKQCLAEVEQARA